MKLRLEPQPVRELTLEVKDSAPVVLRIRPVDLEINEKAMAISALATKRGMRGVESKSITEYLAAIIENYSDIEGFIRKLDLSTLGELVTMVSDISAGKVYDEEEKKSQ